MALRMDVPGPAVRYPVCRGGGAFGQLAKPHGEAERGEAGEEGEEQAGDGVHQAGGVEVETGDGFFVGAVGMQFGGGGEDGGGEGAGDGGGHGGEALAEIEQAGGGEAEEGGGDDAFDRVQKDGQHGVELNDAAEVEQEAEGLAVRTNPADAEPGDALLGEAVVGGEFDGGADREADAEAEQAPAVADEGEDEGGFDEEGDDPDSLDDGDLLEAGEGVAEDGEGKVGEEGADDEEGEGAGVGAEIFGDLHPRFDARPAGEEGAEAEDADGAHQREAGGEQAVGAGGFAVGLELSDVLDVGAGEADGGHAEVSDEDEEGAVEAVGFHPDAGEDEGRDEEAGGEIEDAGAGFGGDVLEQAAIMRHEGFR